jgi:hypothetical protein
MAPIECGDGHSHDERCVVNSCVWTVPRTPLITRDTDDAELHDTPFSVKLTPVCGDGRWHKWYQTAAEELGLCDVVVKGKLRACTVFLKVVLHMIATQHTYSSTVLWARGRSRFCADFTAHSLTTLYMESPELNDDYMELCARKAVTEAARANGDPSLRTISRLEVVYAGHDMHTGRLVWMSAAESDVGNDEDRCTVNAKFKHMRLQSVVTAFSTASTWNKARHEWNQVAIADDNTGSGVSRCQCSQENIKEIYAMRHKTGLVIGPIGKNCITHISGYVKGSSTGIPMSDGDMAVQNGPDASQDSDPNMILYEALVRAQKERALLKKKACSVCHQVPPGRKRKCPEHFNSRHCIGNGCTNLCWLKDGEKVGKGVKLWCDDCRTCNVCGDVRDQGQPACPTHHTGVSCSSCKTIVVWFSAGERVPSRVECDACRICDVCNAPYEQGQKGCSEHYTWVKCPRREWGKRCIRGTWIPRGADWPADERCSQCMNFCAHTGCHASVNKKRNTGTYFPKCYHHGHSPAPPWREGVSHSPRFKRQRYI